MLHFKIAEVKEITCYAHAKKITSPKLKHFLEICAKLEEH